MTYRVVVSGPAQEDLVDILDYVSYELRSQPAAVRLLERLENAIASLSSFPEMHHRYASVNQRGRNIRLMSAGNYCVIYRVEKDERVVQVLRVMYGGRNIDGLIGGLTEQRDGGPSAGFLPKG